MTPQTPTPMAFWRADQSRKISKRIVVEATLTLQTPAHFGNGDGSDTTDMPLLIDVAAGVPLLTGASIAGALRACLVAAGAKEQDIVALFGETKQSDEGVQSALIVEDAFGENFDIEVRDGVTLNAKSRTAQDGTLFNLETWRAGTSFTLRFQIVVGQNKRNTTPDEAALLKTLRDALAGFNNGAITLGARKQRGYGRVQLTHVRSKTFDLCSVDGLIDWIQHGNAPLAENEMAFTLGNGLGAGFSIKATFALDGSLLIRGPGSDAKVQPDMAQLHTYDPESKSRQPVVTGTSLAGALRARALRIARLLANNDDGIADPFVDQMFGKTSHASHVRVEENLVKGAVTNLVQSRVAIDRFTGGALESALFDEQPAFGKGDTKVQVNVSLRKHDDMVAEAGMLLLLLKDLWTGDLPIGGEISVGRGRLKGIEATISQGGTTLATLKQEKDGIGLNAVSPEDRKKLECFVDALKVKLQGGK